MEFLFKRASKEDSNVIGYLVIKLTEEICERTNSQHFGIDLEGTIKRCEELISAGHYAAIIGYLNEEPVALATMSETYALYAGGKIGVIQEFYVSPPARSSGLGARLLEKVKEYGIEENWSCIELCTPPLAEFERTVSFYQQNGFKPVGGRKMRQNLGKNG